MKEKRTVLSAAMPAICACGLAVIAAGCSPEWIAGGAPETPPGAYLDDPAPATDEEEVALVPKPEVEVQPTTEVTPETEVEILVPDDTKAPVVQMTPVQPAPPAEKVIIYTVCAGDSLSEIGESYGADWKAIAAYNKLDIKKPLRVNQQIRIPESLIRQKGAKALSDVKNLDLKPVAPVPAKKPVPEKKPAATVKKTDLAPVAPVAPADGKKPVTPAKGQQIHVVVSGDMLSKLALMYKVPATAIANANGIKLDSMLRIGQKLIIPTDYVPPRKAKPAAPKVKKEAPAPVVQQKDNAAQTDTSAPALPDDTSAPALPDDTSAPALPDDTSVPALPDDNASSASSGNGGLSAEDLEFSYVTTARKGTTLRSNARNMKFNLDDVLRLNPGIGADEKFESDRQIRMPVKR